MSFMGPNCQAYFGGGGVERVGDVVVVAVVVVVVAIVAGLMRIRNSKEMNCVL